MDDWFGRALAHAMAVSAPDRLQSELLPQPPKVFAARLRFHGIAGLLAADADAMASHPTWLVEALARVGIAPLLLKGTALAYGLCPLSRSGHARAWDSDLLVAPEHLPEARRILAASGFSRPRDDAAAAHQEDWWFDSGFDHRRGIDLHWIKSQSAAMEAIVPAADLVATRQPLPRLSPQAWPPSPVLTFLQLHINQLAHSANGHVVEGVFVQGAGRLGWVVDIHLIASAFSAQEWAELVRACLAREVAPSVAASLRRAQALLGTAIPHGVLGQLGQQAAPSIASAYFDYTAPLHRLALDWRATCGWRQAQGQTREHILPPRARIMYMHPEYPDWPLALLQLRPVGQMALRTHSGGGRHA